MRKPRRGDRVVAKKLAPNQNEWEQKLKDLKHELIKKPSGQQKIEEEVKEIKDNLQYRKSFSLTKKEAVIYATSTITAGILIGFFIGRL